MRTSSPVWRRIAASVATFSRYHLLRVWFSGISSRFFASGQIFSIAAVAACTARGVNAGPRLLNPPGNRLVSTGASLKPELRRSTEQ